MYSDVYTNPVAKGEEDKVQGILEKLYEYYVNHIEKMPRELQLIAEREGKGRAAVDYISGMTDGYAMEKFGEIYIPFAWTVK
jgi:dGTPase